MEESFYGLLYDAFDPFMVDVSACYDSGDSMELAIDMKDKCESFII